MHTAKKILIDHLDSKQESRGSASWSKFSKKKGFIPWKEGLGKETQQEPICFFNDLV